MQALHDIWKYRAGEARLFLAGEDIPAGWADSPADPLDHDHDGRKGGGRKRKVTP